MESRPHVYDQCACGANKQKKSARCWDCWIEYRGSLTSPICECGEPKTRTSKQCQACYHTKNSRSPEYMRDYHLRTKYGITQEDFQSLLDAQNGECAICSTSEPECNQQFQVDHDHGCCPGKKTCGKCIRGLLCCRCNQVLGLMYDNVDLLLKAVDYLNAIPLFLLLKRSASDFD